MIALLPLLLLFIVAAAANRRDAAPSSPAALPTDGRITSPFGPRGERIHQGIDIAAPRGTAANAALPGVVIDVSPDGTRTNYGNTVIVQHRDGSATVYAHLESFDSRHAWVGAPVRTGDKLGAVGTTQAPMPPGQHPHLHFEVLAEVVRDRNGRVILNSETPQRINPEWWLQAVRQAQ